MSYDDDDLRARFAKLVATPHPRLGTRRDVLPASLGGREPAMQALLKEAHAIAPLPLLERRMTGRRMLGVSQEALRRISVLSIAWTRSRDPLLLRRAEAELLAVCAFSDWNPSHYLDTAEMSLAVALGYDWLHSALTEEARATIAGGLWRHGLKTALDDKPWWVDARNNWGQVCHAGVTAAALALAESHPDEALGVVKRAFGKMALAMEAYAPDGVYPEGPSYWNYGTSFNLAFFILVESALGTSHGLDQMPGFAASADFMSHVTAPSGYYFNFADCQCVRRCLPELLWLAQRFPDRFGGSAFATERRSLSQSPERLLRDRMAPLILILGLRDAPPPPAPAASSSLPLDFHGRGPSEVVLMRGAWDDPATWYVGVKAGSPSTSHGHMDAGSFIVEAGGVRWAVEAGAENYHNLEKRGFHLWDRAQEGERWDVFRYGNRSHNIPVINDERQLVKERAVVREVSLGGDNPRVEVDLSKLYGRSVVRTFNFAGRASLSVEDRLAGLKAGDVVRWQMLTSAAAEPRGQVLTLKQHGRKMRLEAGADAEWRVVEATALYREWDTPQENLRVVSFERRAPAAGILHTTVSLRLVP